MTIRPYAPGDLADILRIWNGSVQAGEVVYPAIDTAYFERKILGSDGYFPALNLVAEADGAVIGFGIAAMKRTFLPGQTHEGTPGYLTALFVDAGHRRRGVGGALLAALEAAMRAAGKRSIVTAEGNPVELDWIIPGTPGHDHNKAPGTDIDCAGYAFLLRAGYQDAHHEAAMYLDLADYRAPEGMAARQARLRAEGIETGRYNPALGYDFDRMCDRVGSEYWRKVLKDETASERPRVILAATTEEHIVAFTGPVDRQASGRGWFTGICTDPQYEKRGIATVLFNLLMQEFIAVGATFSTLFTGDDGHAQRLYARTGFRVARRFAIMRREI